MPDLMGMVVVVATSAEERFPWISRLMASTILAIEKPCWPGVGAGAVA